MDSIERNKRIGSIFLKKKSIKYFMQMENNYVSRIMEHFDKSIRTYLDKMIATLKDDGLVTTEKIGTKNIISFTEKGKKVKKELKKLNNYYINV